MSWTSGVKGKAEGSAWTDPLPDWEYGGGTMAIAPSLGPVGSLRAGPIPGAPTAWRDGVDRSLEWSELRFPGGQRGDRRPGVRVAFLRALG